jgi:predicted transcriptional regulator
VRRYKLVFEESQAREIESLAREYGLTEQAVLEQLVDVGLAEVRTDAGERFEPTQLRE